MQKKWGSMKTVDYDYGSITIAGLCFVNNCAVTKKHSVGCVPPTLVATSKCQQGRAVSKVPCLGWVGIHTYPPLWYTHPHLFGKRGKRPSHLVCPPPKNGPWIRHTKPQKGHGTRHMHPLVDRQTLVKTLLACNYHWGW